MKVYYSCLKNFGGLWRAVIVNEAFGYHLVLVLLITDEGNQACYPFANGIL